MFLAFNGSMRLTGSGAYLAHYELESVLIVIHIKMWCAGVEQ